MKVSKLFFCIALLVCPYLQGQDIHFSQFYASPLTLNPGLTGVINGNIRAVANYRNQWNGFAPFTTYAGSVDMNLGQGFLKNDLIGIGVNFFADKAGDASFGTTQTNISIAYIKSLSGSNSAHRSYISVGFEGGLAQRTIDYTALTFGNQFDGIDYNAAIAGESIGADHFTFADLSGGIAWFLIPRDDKFSMYTGIAFHHVNQPSQSFSGGTDNTLFMRINYTIGMQIPITYSLDLVPTVMYQVQGPYTEAMGGTSIKCYVNGREYSSTAISLGVWQRISSKIDNGYAADATVIASRFDWKTLSLGLSYDINISSLKAASNGNGGLELSLQWTGALPHRDRKIDCPKF